MDLAERKMLLRFIPNEDTPAETSWLEELLGRSSYRGGDGEDEVQSSSAKLLPCSFRVLVLFLSSPALDDELDNFLFLLYLEQEKVLFAVGIVCPWLWQFCF